jgi:hypothetical protein
LVFDSPFTQFYFTTADGVVGIRQLSPVGRGSGDGSHELSINYDHAKHGPGYKNLKILANLFFQEIGHFEWPGFLLLALLRQLVKQSLFLCSFLYLPGTVCLLGVLTISE